MQQKVEIITNDIVHFRKMLDKNTQKWILCSEWAGQALAHLEFGSSVNPITTRGADYAQGIIASLPGFENLAAALIKDKQTLIIVLYEVNQMSDHLNSIKVGYK